VGVERFRGFLDPGDYLRDHRRMPRLGWLGLGAAFAGALCLALPYPGMFLSMGLAIAALGTGLAAWRRRSDPGPARMAGAGALTVGSIAFLLAGAKYVLTLLALSRIEALL
jgi:drug/metabolite transporter (DMT)-like permease